MQINQAGSFKLSATASGLSEGDSNFFAVSPAAASQMVFSQEPSPTATAGVAFSTQPIVKEEDQYGNVITTDSTNTVTASTGSLGTAALLGTTTVTLSSGVATFSGLHYDKAETMNITFSTTADGFTATSTNVVVSPAAASQFVIGQQPLSTAMAGQVFGIQPIVTEEDQFGNVITGDSTHTVTAARVQRGRRPSRGRPR